jgi:hypothetical protein
MNTKISHERKLGNEVIYHHNVTLVKCGNIIVSCFGQFEPLTRESLASG